MGALSACLETPSDYQGQATLQTVDILLVHENGDTSSTLQVPAGESFTLVAKVYPYQLQEELSFRWFENSENIFSGMAFHYENSTAIPDSLSICDKAGNNVGTKFVVLQNTPPKVIEISEPVEGDTLAGFNNAAYHFAWQGQDIDNDTIYYSIELDGILSPAGIWNEVEQGAIGPGKHSLRIIAYDKYGNSDTSQVRTFYVKVQEVF